MTQNQLKHILGRFLKNDLKFKSLEKYRQIFFCMASIMCMHRWVKNRSYATILRPLHSLYSCVEPLI